MQQLTLVAVSCETLRDLLFWVAQDAIAHVGRLFLHPSSTPVKVGLFCFIVGLFGFDSRTLLIDAATRTTSMKRRLSLVGLFGFVSRALLILLHTTFYRRAHLFCSRALFLYSRALLLRCFAFASKREALLTLVHTVGAVRA